MEIFWIIQSQHKINKKKRNLWKISRLFQNCICHVHPSVMKVCSHTCNPYFDFKWLFLKTLHACLFLGNYNSKFLIYRGLYRRYFILIDSIYILIQWDMVTLHILTHYFCIFSAYFNIWRYSFLMGSINWYLELLWIWNRIWGNFSYYCICESKINSYIDNMVNSNVVV